ncbi:MAG: PadR family transcriptional regulator [Magnetospirillum sp. WYHS-4]
MDARTLCLGVLTLGDASGYEIKKIVEEGPFSHFHETSFGSIYPALGRLSAEGLVTFREVAQEGRPAKKVYSVTPKGRDALAKALRAEPARDTVRSDALFMLFFGDLMDGGRRREVFATYLGNLRRQMADMAQCGAESDPPARRFVHGLGLAAYEALIRYMEDNRHLLDEETNP